MLDKISGKIIIILSLLFGLMFFSVFELKNISEVTFIVGLGLMAWLAYQYIHPWLMIRRKAYIELTIKEESFLQSFKSSLLLKLLSAMLALISGFGSLWTVAGFGRISNMPYFEWALLILSTFSFVLIYSWFKKKSKSHVKSQFGFMVLWPASLTNLFLISIIYIIGFMFFAEMPNYTAMNWTEIFDSAKNQNTAKMEWIKWLLTIDTAIQHTLFAGLQRLSLTESSESIALIIGTKLFLWVLVLGFTALKFGLVWVVLLGIVSYVLAFRAQQNTEDTVTRGFSAGFIISLSGLFGLYFLISQINIGSLYRVVTTPMEIKPIVLSTECTPQSKEEFKGILLEDFDKKLTNEQRELQAKLDEKIDIILEDIFNDELIDSGIESFLDWNFSVIGSYTQLFFKGADLFDRPGLESLLSEKFNEFAGNSIEQILQERLQEFDTQFLDDVKNILNDISQQNIVMFGSEDNCFNENLLDVSLDGVKLNPVGSGGLAAMLAGRVSARIVAQVSSRVAGQMAARASAKGAAKVGGRAVSLAAGTTAASIALAPCAATGPAIGICAGLAGVTVGTISWFTVDAGVVIIDEFLNRDELRTTIYETLEEQKITLKDELRQNYHSHIISIFSEFKKETYRVIEMIL